ncbi:hypothetical protein FGO68_gene5941 [Halteria grandinella]|uniref:Peptidyl-prolyl cis-trans isomerase n=1 Tax=Halteria grandinella TaxID=5974 RepID=A0A8J8NHX2_HALGN|nr:hypothetical protein FGO68_gene5941 [Halteria grandinella]
MSVTLHLNEPFGDLKFELYPKEAPLATRNFLSLCAQGTYNNTLFHRNIRGFLLQGGDPTNTGKGGASIYPTPDHYFHDEIHPDLKHDKRGVLSMANSGKDKNGSQFFITYAKQGALDGKYTVFGQMIDGHETLDKLEKEPVGGKGNRPLNEIKVVGVTIHANPIAEMDWEEEEERANQDK